MRPRTAIAALALTAACSSGEDRIDPYPVSVDVSRGPVMTTVSAGVSGPTMPAIIDTLSPVTILDSFVPGEPEQSPRRRQVELVLHAGTGTDTTPRVAFTGVSTFDLHPCEGVDDLCSVGLDGQTQATRAVIGADVLARNAVRFDMVGSAVSFFPDIAGDDAARGRTCEAVFTSPFAGGGTIVLSGSEVPFTGNRIALGACLHHDADGETAAVRGTDNLLILSSGLAVSLLSRSAYERYVAAVADAAIAPSFATLPATRLWLPSGPLSGRLGSITRLAVVGAGASQRGPCQELYANHVMSRDRCNRGEVPAGECPCAKKRTFCSTAAAVEVDRSFPILVVDDLEPLLQALRDELRPAYAEVDGVLSMAALAPLSVDVDYPNGRLIARCETDIGCQARPAVRSRDSLDEIEACLPVEPEPVTRDR